MFRVVHTICDIAQTQLKYDNEIGVLNTLWGTSGRVLYP